MLLFADCFYPPDKPTNRMVISVMNSSTSIRLEHVIGQSRKKADVQFTDSITAKAKKQVQQTVFGINTEQRAISTTRQWEKSVGTLYNHYLSYSQEFGRILAGAACKQPNFPSSKPAVATFAVITLFETQRCGQLHGYRTQTKPHNNGYQLPFSDLDSHTLEF